MFEPTQIENWIYQTSIAIDEIDSLLTDSSGKRIWSYYPERQVWPFEVYNLQAGTDLKSLNTSSNRWMMSGLYQIKLVIKGRPTTAIRTALDKLDDAFDSGRTVQLNGWAFSSTRESPIKYAEEEPQNPSIKYFHLGGLYRINAFQL